ncbi:DNA-binding protein WhiA [Caldicellulosiruptor naganoensis]|uniref:Probable cell division protein WhiA n=1 Tax=Caldicellulosiruptor naganoensis TaxID=29324 RepID=A0ABY7BJD4_9FIRM|nr:DNA-binding protein WhiA [Caldicellulosiruptor naganoensis]WAM31997.1 DNA-binding protein WhiA [Caldicellulosiruptor naganoensis]
MSFSSSAKAEVSKKLSQATCCRKAAIAAFLKFSGVIYQSDGIFSFKASFENAQTARSFFLLMKNGFSKHCEVTIKKNSKLNKNYVYTIILPPSNDNLQILKDLHFVKKASKEYILSFSLKEELVKKKCCKKAFLQATFLSCGSITNPEKMYHLEFDLKTKEDAEFLQKVLRYFEFEAKIIERKSHYVVYLKEGEQIVDFLNIIGAHAALLELENIRIVKELRNNVNRLVNCETANLEKTINASMRHIENIEFIEKTIGIDSLPENLREIARLRIKYKDASLKELGNMLKTPLGKSGVNHRLRKIDKIAEELRKGGISYAKPSDES